MRRPSHMSRLSCPSRLSCGNSIALPRRSFVRASAGLAAIIAAGRAPAAFTRSMLAARNGLMAGSKSQSIIPPSGYIDFNITGVSRQSRFFNSGIVPTANTTVEFMLVKNSSPAYATGFQTGCRAGWVNGAMQLNIHPAMWHIWFLWNTAGVELDTNDSFNPPPFETPEYLLCGFRAGGIVTADGFNPTVNYAKDFQTNYYSSRSNAFYIGDVNENGTAKGRTDSQGSGRIAWVKFYESGVLIRNFVAGEISGAPVFHDEITGINLQSEGNAAASSIRYVAL